LISENRKDKDDLQHVWAQISPGHPTGLEPAPRTIDTMPEVHEQLKKPLISENRKSGDDL
jgi:hypothetical protein